MTKFLAKVMLMALLTLSSLGNYWYTFGLWPKSWFCFFGFFLLSVIIMLINQEIDRD